MYKVCLFYKYVLLTYDIYLFNQLVKQHPKILYPDNFWIVGITQQKTNYYLVVYDDSCSVLQRFVEVIESSSDIDLKFISYKDFEEIKEIGSGGYGTVYTAKCKN